MELIPTLVRVPVGTTIEFMCKYHNTELLDIIIFENGMIKVRDTDQYMRCDNNLMKKWYIKMSDKPMMVQCMLQNKQNLTVGILTAHIYPGLTLFRSQHCALLYLFILDHPGAQCVVYINCILVLFIFRSLLAIKVQL